MDKLKEIFGKFAAVLRQNWADLLKPITVLLCICIIIPLALAATNLLTEPKIDALQKEQAKASRRELYDASDFKEEKAKDFTYYVAEKDGETVGYLFETAAKGYGGEVSVMTAIDPDGTVHAVKILDVSNETPGLGQNTANESFYKQYAGKKPETELTAVKHGTAKADSEIDAVTGATISSKAVTAAVNKAVSQFRTATQKSAEVAK